MPSLSLSLPLPGPTQGAAACSAGHCAAQPVAANGTGPGAPVRLVRAQTTAADTAQPADAPLNPLFADTLRALGLADAAAETLAPDAEAPATPPADGVAQPGLPAPATPEASFAMVPPSAPPMPFVPPAWPAEAARSTSTSTSTSTITSTSTSTITSTITSAATAPTGLPLAAASAAATAQPQASNSARPANHLPAPLAQVPASGEDAAAAVLGATGRPMPATRPVALPAPPPGAPTAAGPAPVSAGLFAPAPPTSRRPGADGDPAPQTDTGATGLSDSALAAARPGLAGPAPDTLVSASPIRLASSASPPEQRQALASALGERLQVQIAQRSELAVIRIEPPQLGSIEIAIRHEAGNLQVHLHASHGEVQRQLQQLGDTLKQDLAQRHAGEVSVQVGAETRDGDGRQRSRQAQPDNPAAPGRALAEAQDDTTGAPSRFALSSSDLN